MFRIGGAPRRASSRRLTSVLGIASGALLIVAGVRLWAGAPLAAVSGDGVSLVEEHSDPPPPPPLPRTDKKEKKETAEDAFVAATPARKTEAATTAKPTAPAGPRECVDIPGVILAQDDPSTVKNLWPACSQKWTEDCRAAGCCADWDMKCYEKDKVWSACNTECSNVDTNNDSWTCSQLWPPLPRTFETCRRACQDSPDCRLATFSADNSGTCMLSKPYSTRIVWAADLTNSTLCGFSGEEIQELEGKIDEQLPWEFPEDAEGGRL